MSGEEFLNSIRYLDNEVNALDYERCRIKDRRQDILDSAENIGGFVGDRVQHSIGSKTESIGIALADLITPEQVERKINAYQMRINKKIDELVDMKNKASEMVDMIPEAQYRALLRYRYFDCLKWASIADIFGYTQNWVEIDLKRKAVEAFEKHYQKIPCKTM